MRLSVIIPVRNGGQDLYYCLRAMAASTRAPDEVIVVDDSSVDSSAALARDLGARVFALTDGSHGPAFARNRGADIAQGDILVFIDADVTVHPNALQLIEKYFAEHLEVDALFGSYDDDPPKQGLITRYKNLQHHYVHHHGRREAGTFWAGCGAIRREVFVALGGFDENYSRPSIEDIELGTRIKRAGRHIWLCPDVQVAHRKRWTFISWLRADIFDRAVPWTRLILSTAQLPSDLNLDSKSRASALMVWMFLVFFVMGFWFYWVWLCALFAAFVTVILNSDLYSFFARRGGFGFAVGAFGLHSLYYLYSSLVFGSMLMWHLLIRKLKPIRAKR